MDPPTAPTLDVSAGYILAYRLFDVAYAIDLAKAEENWARTVRTGSSRGRLTTTPPKAIAFGVPPAALALGTITLALPEGPLAAIVTARLYDFGVVSIAVRVAVVDLSWPAFSRRMYAVDRAVGLAPATSLWTQLLERVRLGVGDTLVRPIASPLEEDYRVGVASAFTEPVAAEALVNRLDIVPLMSGKHRKLSDGARRDLLRHQ